MNTIQTVQKPFLHRKFLFRHLLLLLLVALVIFSLVACDTKKPITTSACKKLYERWLNVVSDDLSYADKCVIVSENCVLYNNGSEVQYSGDEMQYDRLVSLSTQLKSFFTTMDLRSLVEEDKLEGYDAVGLANTLVITFREDHTLADTGFMLMSASVSFYYGGAQKDTVYMQIHYSENEENAIAELYFNVTDSELLYIRSKIKESSNTVVVPTEAYAGKALL